MSYEPEDCVPFNTHAEGLDSRVLSACTLDITTLTC